jgi:hypothetical protein
MPGLYKDFHPERQRQAPLQREPPERRVQAVLLLSSVPSRLPPETILRCSHADQTRHLEKDVKIASHSVKTKKKKKNITSDDDLLLSFGVKKM